MFMATLIAAETLRAGDVSVALDALESDPVVRGALGEEYADYFINTKRNEWNTHQRMVSDWEREQYLVSF